LFGINFPSNGIDMATPVGDTQPHDAQPRVVSLLSGLTEAVCLMGLGHFLVGRSHECDWPPEVLSLPQISEPRVDPQAAAAVIDAQVHQSMQTSGTAYELNAEQLAKLEPTVVLVQDSCRVCAVSPGDLQSCGILSSTELNCGKAMGLPGRCSVLTVFPKCLEDVLGDIQSVGDTLGQPEKAADFIFDLRSRLNAVSDQAQGFAEMRRYRFGPQPKPKVLVLEWCDPVMGCGYWIPELVTLAGGQCLFGGVGEHTEYISPQDIADAEPDYIIFACCGFSVERSVRELCQTSLLTNPLWKSLVAVREERVFISDGNRYFNRSGPSVVDSAEIVAQVLGLEPTQKYGPEAVMPLKEALSHFGGVPRDAPQQMGSQEMGLELPLEKAIQVVKETVEALQEGGEAGIMRAYGHSVVSSCMPLDRYISVILKNPDFLPLASKTLTPKYDEPQSTDKTHAKMQVVMEGEAGATYVFRMLAVEAAQDGKWMIEGVHKVA